MNDDEVLNAIKVLNESGWLTRHDQYIRDNEKNRILGKIRSLITESENKNENIIHERKGTH